MLTLCGLSFLSSLCESFLSSVEFHAFSWGDNRLWCDHQVLYSLWVCIFHMSPVSFTVCALHFEAGQILHYTYLTDLSLNEQDDQVLTGAHRPVGFRFSGELQLSVVWKKSYDYLIKLEVGSSSVYAPQHQFLCRGRWHRVIFLL